jgi:hypothetical protein
MRGYSTNGGEWRSDVSAVAAALVSDAGRPVANISISVSTSRMTDASRSAYGALAREAATTVSAARGTTRRTGTWRSGGTQVPVGGQHLRDDPHPHRGLLVMARRRQR